MVLRPEELAAQSEIYNAGKRDKMIKGGLKTAGGLAFLGGSLGAAAKIAPFLSEYITPDIAVKGISKLNPKLGDFLQRGLNKGLDVKEGLNFLKDKVGSEKASTNENQNIISEISPELWEFVKERIGMGDSPIDVATMALTSKKFSSAIGELQNRINIPLRDIIKSVFGGQQTANQPQQTANQPQQTPSIKQNTDQALMAALEKILQM